MLPTPPGGFERVSEIVARRQYDLVAAERRRSKFCDRFLEHWNGFLEHPRS